MGERSAESPTGGTAGVAFKARLATALLADMFLSRTSRPVSVCLSDRKQKKAKRTCLQH